jgi:hypothetical protein
MSILSGLLHKGDNERTAKLKADKKSKREAKVARQKTHKEMKRKHAADKRSKRNTRKKTADTKS